MSQFAQQPLATSNNDSQSSPLLQTPSGDAPSIPPTFSTDGMMLNDEEIASIAGLNAYLGNGGFLLLEIWSKNLKSSDDTAEGRFSNFSNSIDDHWNNVDDEEFRELLNYGNPIGSVTDLNKTDVWMLKMIHQS